MEPLKLRALALAWIVWMGTPLSGQDEDCRASGILSLAASPPPLSSAISSSPGVLPAALMQRMRMMMDGWISPIRSSVSISFSGEGLRRRLPFPGPVLIRPKMDTAALSGPGEAFGYSRARIREWPPVAPSILGAPQTRVAPAGGRSARLARFSIPQRPLPSQAVWTGKFFVGP